MISLAEENYLKSIYHLSKGGERSVSTNEIAESQHTKAASATDMMKKLAAKALISYEKYHGVELTNKGATEALTVIRKHRLWETFLVQKLGFSWDEVHDVAEQLEHIHSPLLIEKLDEFLGKPEADPHGHPIPDKAGRIKVGPQQPLASGAEGHTMTVSSVQNSTQQFLQYLDRMGIKIGSQITIGEKIGFDGSMSVVVDGRKRQVLSREASENILTRK